MINNIRFLTLDYECVRNGTYSPGWYFIDETWNYQGPFDTQEEALAALDHYAETL